MRTLAFVVSLIACFFGLSELGDSSDILMCYFIVLFVNLKLVKFNPYSAIYFYSLFYSIYFVAYPVVVHFGLLDSHFLLETLRLQLLFISSLYLVHGVFYKDFGNKIKKYEPLKNRKAIVVVFSILFCLAVLYLADSMIGGGVNKLDVRSNRSALSILSPSIHVLNGIALLLLIDNYRKRKRIIGLSIILAVCIGFIAVFISYERAFIVRLLMGSVIIFSFYKRNIGLLILISLPIVIVLFSFLKMRTLEGIAPEYLLYMEFKTIGRLTESTIDYFQGVPYGYGVYMFNEFLQRISLDLYNISADYDLVKITQDNIYKDASVGLGFSPISQWYGDYGKGGVLVGGGFLGAVMITLYRFSQRSVVNVFVYVAFLVCISTTLRFSSLAWYATSMKSMILPVIFIFCLIRILKLPNYRTRYSTSLSTI